MTSQEEAQKEAELQAQETRQSAHWGATGEQQSDEHPPRVSLAEKVAAVFENTIHGIAAATMLHASAPETNVHQVDQAHENAAYERNVYWQENGQGMSSGNQPATGQQSPVDNAFELLEARQNLNERKEKMEKEQADSRDANQFEGIAPDSPAQEYWQESHRVDDSNVTFTNELPAQRDQPKQSMEEMFDDYRSNYTNYLIGAANGDSQQAAGMASRDMYQQLAQQSGQSPQSDYDQLNDEEKSSLVEKGLSDQYGQEAVDRLQEQQQGMERVARESRHR